MKNNKAFWLAISFILIVCVGVVPEGRIAIMGALYEVNPDWFIEENTITKGSWEEFSISDSKSAVASKLLSPGRGDVYIDKRYYRENRFGLLTPLTATDVNEILNSRDEWKVYLSKKASDYVVFRFNKGSLVSIERYLKTLELP